MYPMVSLTLALWTQPVFSCQPGSPGAPLQDVILQVLQPASEAPELQTSKFNVRVQLDQ